LKRKGVYPYDYVDSVEKLIDTSFPPKGAFYSKLKEENYNHVWKKKYGRNLIFHRSENITTFTIYLMFYY